MAQTNSRTSKRDTFPVYQPQTILYARWAEDGLWYKAKVTDLLPETQSYLVVFVDYGNSQQCTLADLAPLDTMTTRAAPPSLVSEDPAVLEAQRRARIEERRAQLKQEEEARKQALEEKRRAVAEKKAKLEALDREEQMRKMEEQRARLQGGNVTPVKPVAQSVGTPVNVATPSGGVGSSANNSNANTPSLKAQAASTPAAVDGGSEKKKLAARMTLSVVGGSGGKLGMMKGVTLKELKEVAKQSPGVASTPAAAATPKTPAATLDGGSVLSGEAKANRVLDFGAGDTPTKKTVVAEVTRGTTSSSTPAAGGTAPPAPVGVFSEDEEEEESSTSMTPLKSGGGGGGGGGSVVKTGGGSGLKKPPPVVVEDSDGETPEAFNPSPSPSPGGTAATSPMTTTTQILGMLEDSLEDDMDELERLRQESDAMDATINLFKQLQQETYKLESTAASYAADLGDLEAEARQLLGE